MTLEQDRFVPDDRKPRTRSELEEMLKSPEFRAAITDGFAQIERGDYVSYPIDEIKRRLRRLRLDE